ncbi:metallophosphatase family protein [Neisseriaceae bacterium TC5R-5]|nr:metallophosphatase family protein [Neisseriaceae bacterium TC5R-5]
MIVRIAAISDIHGNLAALEAVLADIAQQHADITVNLGDILSGALLPSETADCLMALDLPTIRGNHERQLLGGQPDKMSPSDRYAHQQLNPTQRNWLASLPSEHWLNEQVLMVHGTPDSDLDYFLDTVTAAGCRAATEQEVHTRAGACKASLILCGHTHLPRSMQLDNGCLIVNPGSVGLQAYDDERPHYHRMETCSPHARYAIIEHQADGWSVSWRLVDYDWHSAAALATHHQRLDWVAPLLRGRVADH